jgi:hypothetical protein
VEGIFFEVPLGTVSAALGMTVEARLLPAIMRRDIWDAKDWSSSGVPASPRRYSDRRVRGRWWEVLEKPSPDMSAILLPGWEDF